MPLRRFVKRYSYWAADTASDHLQLKTANLASSIQINLCGDELRWYADTSGSHRQCLKGITISGPQSRPFVVDGNQPKLVRVIFQNDGIHPFLGTSVSVLHNQLISLENIWGMEIRQLHQQLVDARGPSLIFEMLDSYLLRRLSKQGINTSTNILDFLSHAFGVSASVKVEDIADSAGISTKHFIKLFTQTLGVTPKLYLRTLRFEQAITRAQDQAIVDWADIAAHCGYYDQSHLIRDFKQFTGLAPGRYIAALPVSSTALQPTWLNTFA